MMSSKMMTSTGCQWLIEGGEVFEHLIENGAYSEAMAATFLRQFAEGLAFMHSAGVVQ